MSFWTNNYKPQQKHRFRLIIGNNPDSQIVWYAKSCDLPKFDITYDRDLVGNFYVNSEANAQWQPITIELYDHAKYISGPILEGPGELGISAGMLALQTVVGQEAPDAGFAITSEDFLFNKRKSFNNTAEGAPSTPVLDNDNNGAVVLDASNSPFGRSISEIRIQKFLHTDRFRVVADGMAAKIAPDIRGEEWVLVDPVIAACDWGNLDASSEEINTITLTLVFKAAYLTEDLKIETQ